MMTEENSNKRDSFANEGNYSYDASSLSDNGNSEIPSGKTDFKSSYELSYDSQSGQYVKSEYQNTSDGKDTANQTPYSSAYQSYIESELDNTQKKSGSGKFIALAVICLVISLLTGTVSGIFASFALSKFGILRGNTSIQNEDASIKINYAETDSTPTVKAAELAKESVVVIDVYNVIGGNYDNAQKLGSGSGVIWTDNGYIVTCNHVVDGGNTVIVTLDNGDKYEASIVGTDIQTDLAVLKLQLPENVKLKNATLRGTDIVLAEEVIAIGNPLGTLSNTVTNGIVSCLERQIVAEGQSMTLIQTNAAVNPGNSGGGLFDTNGSLVGIVNAKSSQDEVEGIGFAIPIATVIRISSDLIEKGYVTGRPTLGFESVYIDSTNYKNYPDLYDYAVTQNWMFLQVKAGVYVTNTDSVAGYPDGSEKLAFGDRITKVENTRITASGDLISAISHLSVGDSVELTVERGNKTITLTVILGESGAK